MSKSAVLFKRFERLWHWLQALLVLLLIVTGLELHGSITLFGWGESSSLHHWAGFIWGALVVMIFTWIFTTDAWRQFIPKRQGVDSIIQFYLFGIFKGDPHPHEMTPDDKFNPLQRLAYILVLFGLVPLQILSGLALFFYPELRANGILSSVEFIAILHTFCAYSVIAFLIVHLYLITLGKKLTSHMKAMITGKE
ncbi:cytochrome b/b6 domain-containing protein [Vibrio ulleungensis]|uniref:Cytochrome b/b6 domain-containing protein n=1 Tax=Vibrio ulleungensis TaxID=2807619 RepID=A0ABS2HIN6_9VIBR|nr:cytochrome b/b6 domain-containing protein [Vibrio ulleungensis]MBM7036956.1 cytochrome b/b6 domain-containing protein [Vibrio ulleungensis]